MLWLRGWDVLLWLTGCVWGCLSCLCLFYFGVFLCECSCVLLVQLPDMCLNLLHFFKVSWWLHPLFLLRFISGDNLLHIIISRQMLLVWAVWLTLIRVWVPSSHSSQSSHMDPSACFHIRRSDRDLYLCHSDPVTTHLGVCLLMGYWWYTQPRGNSRT